MTPLTDVTSVPVEPGLQISLFGSFVVERAGGDVVDLPAGKAAVLCRMLVAAQGAVVAIDDVAAALWPDDEPINVERLVRPLISRLRRALGADCIVGTPGGWRFAVESATVDAWSVERLEEEAQHALAAGRHGAALAAAEAGLKLFARGEPFIADRYAEWAQPLRRHCDRVARGLRRVAMDSATALGAHDLARAMAELSVEADPLDEAAWRDLMRILVATGRNALALRCYARLRDILVEELGASPSVETEALYMSLLGGDDVGRELEHELLSTVV